MLERVHRAEARFISLEDQLIATHAELASIIGQIIVLEQALKKTEAKKFAPGVLDPAAHIEQELQELTHNQRIVEHKIKLLESQSIAE